MPDSKNHKGKNFIQYTGLAFQMIVIILLFTLGGYKLDQYTQITPLFTLIGILLGIGLSLYYVMKDL